MPSKSTALIALLLTSVVPLAGVLYAGWDWRQIMIFYWLGNITIGLQLLLTIARSSANDLPSLVGIKAVAENSQIDASTDLKTKSSPFNSAFMKVFLIIFFCVHYGMFTFIHGVFVFAITSGSFGIENASSLPPIEQGQIINFWLVTLVLSTALNLIMRQKPLTIPAAYIRITVLQLSIIFGVFLINLLSWPAAAAVLLIGLNLIFEAFNYVKNSKPIGSGPTSPVAA